MIIIYYLINLRTFKHIFLHSNCFNSCCKSIENIIYLKVNIVNGTGIYLLRDNKKEKINWLLHSETSEKAEKAYIASF